jgi:hypothetical protein
VSTRPDRDHFYSVVIKGVCGHRWQTQARATSAVFAASAPAHTVCPFCGDLVARQSVEVVDP